MTNGQNNQLNPDILNLISDNQERITFVENFSHNQAAYFLQTNEFQKNPTKPLHVFYVASKMETSLVSLVKLATFSGNSFLKQVSNFVKNNCYFFVFSAVGFLILIFFKRKKILENSFLSAAKKNIERVSSGDETLDISILETVSSVCLNSQNDKSKAAMKTIVTLFQQKMSNSCQVLSITEQDHDTFFFESDRLSRVYTNIVPYGKEEKSLFLAFHRFEGKKYLLKKIPLMLQDIENFKNSETFFSLSACISFSHPNLCRYITFWADESDSSSEKKSYLQCIKRGRSNSEVWGSFPTSNSFSGFSQDSLDLEKAVFCQVIVQVEFVCGPSLSVHLKNNHLLLSEALYIFLNLLEGLAFLHSQGIYHGNLTSQKIIVCEEGVKIADYGIYKERARPQSQFLESQSWEIRPKLPSLSSDVRCLGIILTELLTNVYGNTSFSLEGQSSSKTQLSKEKGIYCPEMALASQMVWCNPSKPPSLDVIRSSKNLEAWKLNVFETLE